MQLQQNHIFASHYLLERLLGRGGFSEVWLAYDQTADVRVAIKVYAPGTGLDDDGVELFRKEFKIVFDMNHSNLLRPNYYSVEGNMPYLVMPYIEHGSTTKLIGKMPEREVWKFIRDVAAGLAYLHAKEPPVIHQDIKPDNVMLMNDGTYVITDFGISTRARSTLRKSVNANASAGTQAYMGPERFGKQPAPIKASDVWSLGATLYELMEGDAPFGDFGGINQKSGAEIPDINGNYSDELKELVLACLCQETWDRPTAEQLSDYASDKIKGRNPVMPWKKKGTDGQHEIEPTRKPRNLTWLWILLAVVIIGSSFVFYKIKESAIPKFINGHECVDLGLPSGTLWATCNVGANKPEDNGCYYVWGETTIKSEYKWDTYKWCENSRTILTKYNTESRYGTIDNKVVIEMADDAARANWGGSWRIPTHDELKELNVKCSWEWVSRNGKNGYCVTGPNGKSIFLPAAGSYGDFGLVDADSGGTYWSSSLDTILCDGCLLSINSDDVRLTCGYRYMGRSVRPVSTLQK